MPPLTTVLDKYGDRYGPYAFGVVSLLLIWFAIVSPQQRLMKIDFERQEILVEKMRGIVSEQSDMAQTMKRTAEIMDKTVARLPD